ncbi:ribonuclease H-like domain-containing protein, partial [Phaeosphaeriaceae sp. PMI808]
LEKTKLEETQPSSLIDTRAAVASLVDSISDLPKHPPSIYVDLEGVNLSRHGTISILQLFVLPANQTYLVDIHTLREAAFLTRATNGKTLKAILESDDIPKAFFDVRNDSDALYSHFGISLAGICDIQLMELATRSFSKSSVVVDSR